MLSGHNAPTIYYVIQLKFRYKLELKNASYAKSKYNLFYFWFIILEMKNVIIRISGRVQGVGFRYHTMQIAIANNINGFVKNMPDSSVYIEASGPDDEIDLFIEWCRNGPKWAFVENVEVNETTDKAFIGFNIR
jgi:acylphosphatase